MEAVDQQVAAIHFAQYSGFPGADQMSAATATMQTAAGGWPAAKQAVVAAAQLVVQNGPTVAQLASGATTAEQIASALTAFRQGPLVQIVAAFGGAQTQFDTFSTNLSQAYTGSTSANQTAASALQTAQIQLQISEGQLEAAERHAESAGSIAKSIFSGGIYGIVELEKIKKEYDSLHSQTDLLRAEEQAYTLSLGSFEQMLGAAKQADAALDTVNTALQQLVNSIDDTTGQTSSTLVVMQAYLVQFQTEFASAVANARNLAAA
jgi:hypothetical protein